MRARSLRWVTPIDIKEFKSVHKEIVTDPRNPGSVRDDRDCSAHSLGSSACACRQDGPDDRQARGQKG